MPLIDDVPFDRIYKAIVQLDALPPPEPPPPTPFEQHLAKIRLEQGSLIKQLNDDLLAAKADREFQISKLKNKLHLLMEAVDIADRRAEILGEKVMAAADDYERLEIIRQSKMMSPKDVAMISILMLDRGFDTVLCSIALGFTKELIGRKATYMLGLYYDADGDRWRRKVTRGIVNA
jgi:hypothetical protein